MYQINISKKAEKQLLKLTKSFQNSFLEEVSKIAENPSDGKPLKYKLRGYSSWRIGDYRIIYEIVHDQNNINIIAVGHRKDIYEIIRRLLAILFSI